MELASLKLQGSLSDKWGFCGMENMTLIYMQQQKLSSSLKENARKDKNYKFVKRENLKKRRAVSENNQVISAEPLKIYIIQMKSSHCHLRIAF